MPKRTRPSVRDVANAIPNAPKPEEPKNDDRTKLKRKTVLMSDELSDRIKAVADAHNVGINELSRYCIVTTLEMIESGEHEIQGRQVTVLKLDV